MTATVATTKQPQRRAVGPWRVRRPGAVLLLLGVCGRAAAQSPADRFVEHAQGSSAVPADARELIRKTWAECEDCDGNEFITQGLAVLSPRFRQALDAYDSDDYGKCVSIMGDLKSDANPFVRSHATVYEIKCLVEGDRMQEASERITSLGADSLAELGGYTYHRSEVDFLRGFTLVANLQYDEGAVALRQFLENHPDASQRLVISAEQMLAELMSRSPESIGEVADLMTFCGRRLGLSDTGTVVRERQDRIVDLLDKLIEEAEQQESQSSSSGGGGGSGNNSGKQSPSNPMQESRLPGGSGREGDLRDGRRANPAETWGSMPPAERERILQALRDSFPSRYRKLVEQYYEELGKQP